MSNIVVRHLADWPSLLPTISQWFESEWPDYYGPDGPGNAEKDLLAYSKRGKVPVGLLAFCDEVACGFVVLRSEPFASHPNLSPWVGAAYVRPRLRRQGIGAKLLQAVEGEARGVGYRRIYCATGTAATLLQRANWRFLERVMHEEKAVSIYEKAL